MALNHSPKIVTDGLVLCLDAANPKSYPGSGTVWTDLSGNSNNGTLVNGVTYSNSNNGTLSFDGVNDYVILSSPSNKWAWTPSGSGKNILSIELWIKTNDSGWVISKPWNGNGEYNYWITGNNWYQRNGNQSHGLDFSSLLTGKWEHIVCIVTSSEKAVYRNGKLNVNFTNHNITNNSPEFGNSNLPLSLMTLYPYGSGWGGNISHAVVEEIGFYKIYDRVLSSFEVQQNFNATRGRYGI